MTQNYQLFYRFNHPTVKVYRDDPQRGHDTYKIRLAQNDTDGCMLTFWTKEDPVDDLTLIVDNLYSSDGHVLSTETFRLAYITVRNRPLPDAMVPNDKPFSLSLDYSQSFYIRVTTEEDTPAGIYSGSFRLNKDGETLLTDQFSAQVWDFALPSVPTCGTLFGLNQDFIRQNHRVSEEEAKTLYKKYYDFLLQHKICAYYLPFDILDDRADDYLNNGVVTNFCIPYSPDDDVIRAYYKKLSSNPKWFKKGVFYPIDEPSKRDRFHRYEQICHRLEELYPNYNIITPLARSVLFEDGEDSITLLAPYQTRWCPRSDMFGLNGSAGYSEYDIPDHELMRQAILDNYGNMLDRIEKERAGGDEIWWYVCGYPYLLSYCDFNLHNLGIQHRVLFWQQFAFKVEGLLYWGTNNWEFPGSPWTNPCTFDEIRYGDGSLLYNGNEVGINGPVGSIRLEMIRDGIEDFEYLTMAKELLPKEEIDSIINPIINPSPALNMVLTGTQGPDIFVFSNDDDTFYQARCNLGDAIEKRLAR